jgi:hypothetical protein
MTAPNQSHIIQTGVFELRNDETKTNLDGTLTFQWTPRACAVIKGVVTIDDEEYEQVSTMLYEGIVKVYHENLLCGTCYITSTKSQNPMIIDLIGFVVNDVVIGDKSISVEHINFSIPNLMAIHGTQVVHEESSTAIFSRSIFESNGYKITIDGIPHINSKLEELKYIGGYLITYGGRIEKTNGSITSDEADDVLEAFGVFISFLNGKQVNAFFRQGCFEGEVIWTNYRNYIVATYSDVWHIYPEISNSPENNINLLWQNFYSKWKTNEDEREALRMSINWYLEAKSKNGYLEGSIVIAQTALELLYNWIIVETKKMIAGSDAANISASNKIRILLSQINATKEIPSAFSELTNYKSNNSEIIDGPEAIIQIRNAIIHSQLEKRKKLNKIDPYAKLQSLELSIWYIEMIILNVLDYKGMYMDRRNRLSDNKQSFVPWSNNTQTL